jgi:hypothetical protein
MKCGHLYLVSIRKHQKYSLRISFGLQTMSVLESKADAKGSVSGWTLFSRTPLP